MSIARTLILALILLLLQACTGSQRGQSLPAAYDESLSAAENLRQMAAAERETHPDEMRDVPSPPGLDPQTLQLGDADKADRSLQDVLRQFAADAQSPTPAAEVQPPTPTAKREAVQHYIRAREAALDDRHLVAITEYNQARELDSTSPSILRGLARSHASAGNQSRSAQYFQQLLTLQPDDSEAQFVQVLHAASRGNYESAAQIIASRRLADSAFDHDPAAPLLVNFTLFDALRRQGHDRAMIDVAMDIVQPNAFAVDQTIYANQLTAAYRSRSDVWLAIGDAHCRLGEFAHAIEAYDASASLSEGSSDRLLPRRVFANLHLGRKHVAQWLVLQRMTESTSTIDEVELRLCRYLASNAQPVTLLAEAMTQMYHEQPEQADVAIAAATLLERGDALDLLHTFVERRPRDLAAVGQLIRWLAVEDPDSAAQLTISLIEQHPDLAGQYTGTLFFAASRPATLLDSIDALPASAAGDNLRVRMLGLLNAAGEAWSTIKAARDNHPDDEALGALHMELVAVLDEPALLDRVLESTDRFSGININLARSRALRAAGRPDDALRAAERAAQKAGADSPLTVPALLELGNAHLAVAREQDGPNDRRTWAHAAAQLANEVLDHDPANDDAYDLLLNVFTPSGVAGDEDTFRAIVRQLYDENPDSRLYAHLAASDAINRNQFQQARERMLQLYANDPSDARSLELAVRAWQREGALDDAAQWINQRLTQRPGDPLLLEAWADLKLRLDDADTAIDHLRREVDAYDNPAARRTLEQVYRRTRQLDLAFELGEQRLLSRPQGPRREVELAALYGGMAMRSEAIDRIKWVLQHIDQTTFEQISTAVAVLGRLGATDDNDDLNQFTIDFVTAAVEQHPDAPLQVYGAALRSYARLGEIDDGFDRLVKQAALSARGASGSSPQHAAAWRDLAQALIDDGRYTAAARVLHGRVLADVPYQQQTTDALAMLAIVADAADTASEPAARTIRLLHELAAQQDVPRLMGMEEDSRTLEAAMYHASQIFSLLDNEDGAELLLREVIARQPDHAMALNNLGYMLLEAGRSSEELVQWIEQAAALEPDDPSILDSLGWLRYKQGRFDGDGGAVHLIRRAAEAEHEPSAEVLDHLGDAHWRAGNTEAAINAWQEALDQIDQPGQRSRIEQNFRMLQSRAWGMRVADPADMYQRQTGAQLSRLRQKLNAVEQDESPPIAPTFAEHRAEGRSENR